MSQTHTTVDERAVQISIGRAVLDGTLAIPPGARGIVLFAHGSGSSRHSRRNRAVAQSLQEAGLATLLFDLLTAEEEEIDRRTRELRFDIGLLAERVQGAATWIFHRDETQGLRLGLFGASTGAAAALIAAAQMPDSIAAVVSRGGRPDLAGEFLPRVKAPTLLIVGGLDSPVIEMNEAALNHLTQAAARQLVIVPGATHLFEEPGTLEEVARLAGEWFIRHLTPSAFADQASR